MEKNQTEDSSPLTLEDLLKVKRAEQPAPDHWERFDRQLHDRMLQTLANKEAWYHVLLRGIRQRWIQTTSLAFAGLASLMLVNPGMFPRGPLADGPAGVATADQPSASVSAVYTLMHTASETAAARPRMETSTDFDQADFATYAVSASPSDPTHFTREFSAATIRRPAMDTETLETDYRSSGVNSGISRNDRLLF